MRLPLIDKDTNAIVMGAVKSRAYKRGQDIVRNFLVEAEGTWNVEAGVKIEVGVYANMMKVDIPFEYATTYSDGSKKIAKGIVRS